MRIELNGQNTHIYINQNEFNLANTLDCGQCFRWVKGEDDTYTGVVHDILIQVSQTENEIIFHNTLKEDVISIWCNYFDLDTDYKQIHQELVFDEPIKTAINYAGGIRILRQPSFEALCSFIISQNNNIPRIKGCIDKLCKKFGTKINDEYYSFPTPQTLSKLEKEDMQDLSLGYRDEYILDCAKKVVDGEINLDEIAQMDIVSAREALRTIKGVGPKVAECALLFGFYRVEAFPIDTWIKKVLQYYYKDGFPQQARPYAGIAQQYLFHYVRTCPDAPKI